MVDIKIGCQSMQVSHFSDFSGGVSWIYLLFSWSSDWHLSVTWLLILM